ncbi:hypothetical protein [Peptostreptococcus faecalis]|uniref:hypothetical protein n=1 Tax=Peptostreptococcus faecalis TaxID=2045015 RepID=UPI000C7B66C0|nr:hypothetical protein [Peptostreptococcus faecalis]
MLKKGMSLVVALFLIFTAVMPAFGAESSKQEFEYATQRDSTKGSKDLSADNNTSKNKGKVILIDLNRTSLSNFNNIKFLREKMKNDGHVALMNIRGDKGYDDRRNFASMGATGRVNIQSEIELNITESDKKLASLYRSATGKNPGKINLNNINEVDLYNKTKGEFKSNVGYLGETLNLNGKKIAVLGNSDYYNSEGKFIKNRDFSLAVMDGSGRLYNGNVDDINKENLSFPYGISTDYEKLISETNEFYKTSDLIFVELGDTFRLDEYKLELNESTYKTMKYSIYNKVSNYIEKVFEMAGENDTIYVMSSFPSNLDYSNNRRLGTVVRFDMSKKGKGLLTSSTTRREGVMANIDIGVDVLNRFGLKNDEMVGRKLTEVDKASSLSFIEKEYKKIVAISSIRMTVINIYVAFVSLSVIFGALALWKREKIPAKYRKKSLDVLKELMKFGLIMPLAFLTAPILGASSEVQLALSIVVISIAYYLIGTRIFKGDDIKQIGFFSIAMILLIVIDSVISTPLMKANIMSYDPMMGARYYGIGNEYEGVTVGSAILGMAVLLEYKKIPKWLATLFLTVILFTSAYPGMGANVGGAISECIAYFVFVLMIYNVKLDIKKIILVLFSTAVLVAGFAMADILLGIGSHLGNFVKQIQLNGPMEIIYVFARKIDMNIQLAQTTVWVNILLVGILMISIVIIRPTREFLQLKKDHKIIYSGFIAAIIGCLVTLAVNDSGIIAAATDSIYILIPITIMMINKKNKIDGKNIC